MRVLVIGLFSFLVSSFACAQDEILGKWYTEDKKSIVEIYRSGNKYYGKIVYISPQAKSTKDEHNPDPKLRNRSMVNVVIIKDFVYEDKEWSDGTIYDPVDGETYSGKMWIDASGHLNVRGYLLFFYGTQVWQRVK